MISSSSSGEDCFPRPESALDESDSSVSDEEESELLESYENGPLPLASSLTGVARIVAHRLAVRQARVRISARHP
jgi:hypothetical protein